MTTKQVEIVITVHKNAEFLPNSEIKMYFKFLESKYIHKKHDEWYMKSMYQMHSKQHEIGSIIGGSILGFLLY